MNLTYPKVSIDKTGSYFITFYFNNNRYRLYSSKKIGGNTHPNHYRGEEKIKMTYLLAAEVYNHFKNGGQFLEKQPINLTSHKNYLYASLQKKKESNYSKHYLQLLERIYSGITENLGRQNLTSKSLNSFLSRYSNPSSYNTVKKHLNALLEGAYAVGMTPRIEYDKKSRKTKAKLHKPFDDLSSILNEIKGFNFNLYLCCLLTYGCLLRPHREIRELTWGDFTEDLHYIKLSGLRNKSGRNRIVPVPLYVREQLIVGAQDENIFSGTNKAFGSDYFKTLWGRFKAKSNLIEQDQTLYSFRHSGAIEIFKSTGSLTKLQKAMGHSSMRVSLTYLRGLEVAELTEEDMPMINL